MKKDWSREKLPVGSIRIRKRPRGGRRGFYRVRFVKVRNDGPKAERWVPLATHWWRTNHGPVPEGMRVCHLDGNTLNDTPENYGLLTPGDVVYLAHERDPEMSRRNYAACRKATAEHNRLRGRVNRQLNWLRTWWYAVYHDRQAVINEPFRKRRALLEAHGVRVSQNGVIPKHVSLDFEPLRGAAIAERFNFYRKVSPDVFRIQ